MTKYNDDVNKLWDEWMEETGQVSGDPEEFVDWAMAAKRLLPHPQDVKKLVRRQVTQSLRQAKRFDEEGGFTYRARQSVTLFDGGEARKHYFDTDKGGSPTLRQKSVKQRRDAISDHVYRAVCDTERMNKAHPEDPQLNLFTDFTDDVVELRIAEQEDAEKKRGTQILGDRFSAVKAQRAYFYGAASRLSVNTH